VVSVDGNELSHHILHDPSGANKFFGKDYVFKVPEPLHSRFGETVRGRTPYEALFKVIGNEIFSAYLAWHLEATKAQSFEYERVLKRVAEETTRFRDVLVRKYKQLVYRDEYETLETARFKDELRRFAEKRLSDVPASAVAEIVFPMVTRWAEEQAASATETEFDPTMSPTEYEQFCADRFSAIGWVARLTKGSGDQGADIICESNNQRMVVQCKLYSGSVGNAAVQEVIAAREYEYADLAVVVSNAPFTNAARELASAANVRLLHHDEIQTISLS
jgi:HJR/Mrr/RecB family endonuclease